MAEIGDRYAMFYAEKLWELIPAYYRDLDGEGQPPGALRAFVEIIAEQAAILRRSQDRLWEDQFVERADDWAVPYIGDLVATRLVSALLSRARRVDVAKTVYYRRRAGTLRVLEELISDIAGWEGVVTEGFRRLGRAPHGLDPALAGRGGRWSGTPPGALADLRSPLGAQLTRTPFDEYHHTADLRAPRGRDGQIGISRLVFHLYRIGAYHVEGVTPRRFGLPPDEWYTFDPSGRDVPLYARRSRSQALTSGAPTVTSAIFGTSSTASPWEEWTSARPWEIPAAIPCRLLADVAYMLDPTALAPVYATLSAAEQLALSGLYGLRIRGERRLADVLASTSPALSGALAAIRAATLAADCGKAALLDAARGSIRIYPDGVTSSALDVGALQAEELAAPTVAWQPWQQAAIDAERGRFVLRSTVAASDLLTAHHVGSPGAIGAGVFERSAVPWVDAAWPDTLPGPAVSVSGGGAVPALGAPSGILQIEDSRTYTSAGDNTNVAHLRVGSTDGRRPYLRLPESWSFTSSSRDAVLALDGLWLGADGAARQVILRGDWTRVEIRACTLDPGGVAADGSPIEPVGVQVEGAIELLVIQSSIVSQIALVGSGRVERLEIKDSILQASKPIAMPSGELHVTRSTVLGDVDAWRMWATDSLFSGAVRAVDVQNGCFRFSAAREDSLDHVPHPYQSVFFADASALFADTRFGQPAYATLSRAPEAALIASADDTDGRASIHTGASNGGEMGAFNALLNPIKERALRAKVEEFLPFGLLPVFVYET